MPNQEQPKKHWVVNVNTWGTAYLIGTEQEVEDWRKHKSNYEHSMATKQLASFNETLDEELKELWQPL